MPTKKPKLPDFGSDEEAEDFVATADLSQYDLSGAKPHRLDIGGPRYKFEVVKGAKGDYRVRFKLESEVIFATEGYASRTSAMKAIESIRKYAAAAAVSDQAEPGASEQLSTLS